MSTTTCSSCVPPTFKVRGLGVGGREMRMLRLIILPSPDTQTHDWHDYLGKDHLNVQFEYA